MPPAAKGPEAPWDPHDARGSFRTLKLVLVVSPMHALATRRRGTFAETLDFDFIGLAEGGSIQKYLEAHASRVGKRLNYRVRLRGFMAASHLVEDNVGIAIIPETAALRCKESMDLRVLRLTDTWAKRQLLLCVRDIASQPLHIRELVEHIREPVAPQEP